jgi:hypothetical protein
MLDYCRENLRLLSTGFGSSNRSLVNSVLDV